MSESEEEESKPVTENGDDEKKNPETGSNLPKGTLRQMSSESPVMELAIFSGKLNICVIDSTSRRGASM